MPRAANPEFDAFDRTMGQLLSVPHDELKRRMDAYKRRVREEPQSGVAQSPKLAKPDDPSSPRNQPTALISPYNAEIATT